MTPPRRKPKPTDKCAHCSHAEKIHGNSWCWVFGCRCSGFTTRVRRSVTGKFVPVEAEPKPKLLILSDLRRALPKGWTVTEKYGGEMGWCCWVMAGPELIDPEIVVFHPDRQTARRLVLAALKELGRKP